MFGGAGLSCLKEIRGVHELREGLASNVRGICLQVGGNLGGIQLANSVNNRLEFDGGIVGLHGQHALQSRPNDRSPENLYGAVGQNDKENKMLHNFQATQ